MNQQVNNAQSNGDLYEATYALYINRHRRLTISRMAKETKLPWNFVANFTQREQKDNEKLTKFRNYLQHYVNNPHLL